MASAVLGVGQAQDDSDDFGSGPQAPQCVENGSGLAYMPHNEHDPDEFNRLFPSLVLPPDEGLGDEDGDGRDGAHQRCLEIAETIRATSATEGRRRRPLSETLAEASRKRRE